MPPRIKIESLTVDSPVEIIQISQGLITLGREPENHVVIDSTAVSRRHASIFNAEEHWLLKDFESSNGTWINGIKVNPGAVKLLRHGDIVTLADFSMRVSETEPREEAVWRKFPTSVLIFYKEQFDSEFPLATPGSEFKLGGEEGDFFIEGADPEAVFLKVISSEDSLEVQVPNVTEQISVNGTLVSGIVSITDRDELVVPPYRIVVNYPSAAQTSAGMQEGTDYSANKIHAYEHEGMGSSGERDGWVSEAARRKGSLGQKYVFGSTQGEGMDRTMSVPQVQPEPVRPRPSASSGRSGYEMSASQKFSAAYMEDSTPSKGLGDSLLIVFGVVISILLIVVVIYLFTTLT